MGRNAAFGRPHRLDQLRLWWESTNKQTRQNALLVVGVGAIVALLLVAATANDAERSAPLSNASRPQADSGLVVSPPSTVMVGELQAAGTSGIPGELPGLTSTTTTTVLTSRPVPAASGTASSTPTTRTAAPATTSAPAAPATTVPTSEVIFTEVTVPATTTTSPVTIPTTTAPPTSTVTPATTATTSTLLPPLAIPSLLGPG